MKSIKVRLLPAVLMAVVLLSAAPVWAQTPPAGSPVATHGQLSVRDARIVDRNGNPVQLRGMSLFWSHSRSSRAFYNAQTVAHLRNNWQASVVRAAMAVDMNWANDEQGFLTGDPSNKDRMLAVVAAARTNGMYVIIDWHSYQAELRQSEAVAFFTEMSNTFKGVPNVIYEIYNEPICTRPAGAQGGAQCNASETSTQYWESIKPYMQAVTNAIRANDPDNLIIIGTPRWCQHPEIAAASPITGNNLVYALHFYANSTDHRASLRENAFRAMQLGHAVFVSEFGSVSADGAGTHNPTETDIWMDFMDQFHIGWANWALHTSNQTSAALSSGSADNPSGWQLSPSGTYIRGRIQRARKTTPSFYTLTTSVEGTGSIITNPPNKLVDVGREVTFIAQPTSNDWGFVQWGGDLSGTTPVMRVTVNRDMNVTALFRSNTSVRPGLLPGPKVYWSASRSGGGLSVTGPSGSSADVVVYDVRGKAVQKFTASGGSSAYGVRLQSGNYFVVIRDRATGREVYSSRVLVAN